jgi:hypothetical protein
MALCIKQCTTANSAACTARGGRGPKLGKLTSTPGEHR